MRSNLKVHERASRAARSLFLRLAPAIPAAAAASVTGWGVGQVLLVVGAILALQTAYARARPPAHLLPLASHVFVVVLPVLAVGLAGAVAGLAGDPVGLGGLLAPAGLASVTSVLAWRVGLRLDSERTMRVAVIGSARLADALAMELEVDGARGIRVVGWIDGPAESSNDTRSPSSLVKHLGSLDRLRATVRGHDIDLLVYCSADSWRGGSEGPPTPRLVIFESVAEACLDLDVRLVEASYFYEDQLGHVPLGTINSAWFQYIMHPRFRPGSSAVKRLVDLGLGSLFAILLAPLIAIVGLAVKVFDRGPAFYRQRRLGAAGEEFEILKLRTMRVGAETDGGPRWSAADDPRVTRLGRLLRRTHVDELPQLWNVIKGEMTLVGPRPERPEIVPTLELEHLHYDRRHRSKPGITGWAQIRCGYGASDAGTAWKLCHDLFYLKHRSALLDLMIMVETLRVAARHVQFNLRAPDERFIRSARRSFDPVASEGRLRRLRSARFSQDPAAGWANSADGQEADPSRPERDCFRD